jgi:hypothetical protein
MWVNPSGKHKLAGGIDDGIAETFRFRPIAETVSPSIKISAV